MSGEFDLAREGDRLVLRERGKTALAVDLSSGEWRRRLDSRSVRSQPLARAVGLPEPAPRVFDATAGLLRDALLLVGLGCRVVAMERNPMLFALVEDALLRARGGEAAAVLRERLTVKLGDSRDYLRMPEAQGAFDAIVLDPMYPIEKASALPKKETQILRRLLGPEKDARELFDAARAAEPKRIVVKRPLRASPLAPGAAHSFSGKLARFDLYLGGHNT